MSHQSQQSREGIEPGVPVFVHRAIAASLNDLGVEVVFGLIGDSNLFIVNSFVDDFGGQYVSAAHEATAVMMAHGYSARSGKLGVATVTQGPGLTNTVTALVEAVRARVPMVIICGDTAPGNPQNIQSLDQAPLVNATGAAYIVVTDADHAADAVFRAASQAMATSLPVVVNVPTEFQWSEVNYRGQEATPSVSPLIEMAATELDDALGVIASASRPLVLVGRGSADSEAREAILKFAERIGAPVMTTLRGEGLFEESDGCVGVFGTLSSPAGGQAIADSDCVIAFGASLNTWTTVGGELLSGKRVVQCDRDQQALGKFQPLTVGLLAGALEAAEAFLRNIDEAEIPRSPFRDRVLGSLEPGGSINQPPRSKTVTFGSALARISDVLPHSRTIVFDGGRFLGESFKYMHAHEPRAKVYSTAFGAVGMGMGAAIGAAHAVPGERTVLVTGDGGFMMNGLPEFHSAIRNGIPLVVVICNDGSYGAEYDQFVNKGIDPRLSIFRWPDFAGVAAAMGAQSITVESPEHMELAIDALVNGTPWVLIDIKIDPSEVPEVAH